MKLNWGHKLTIFTVLFMLFITSMVYYMMKQDVQLVEKNYYEKGIKYQDEINKHAATKGLDNAIQFDQNKNEILFITAMSGNIAGTMKFYKASDSKLDFDIPFTLNDEGKFIYNVSALQKGLWKITFEWKVGEQAMAVEKEIMIK